MFNVVRICQKWDYIIFLDLKFKTKDGEVL